MSKNDKIINTRHWLYSKGVENGLTVSRRLCSLRLFLNPFKSSGGFVPELKWATCWYQFDPRPLFHLRFRKGLPPESTNLTRLSLILGCDQ